MMAKSKSPHPTTKKIKTETSSPLVLEEYFCLKEMQPRPVTIGYLELIAEKLVEYADLEDSLTINKFLRITKIPLECIHRWRKRCPQLDSAYCYALAALGERREEGSITKRYDTGAVWKRQYQFGIEYREAMEFAAKLAKKEDLEDGGGVKFVILQPMNSDPSMEKYFKQEKDDGSNKTGS